MREIEQEREIGGVKSKKNKNKMRDKGTYKNKSTDIGMVMIRT